MVDRRELPEGTVTFVFTDIEGSTRMAADDPGVFERALAEHNELIRSLIVEHRGIEVRTEGDSFFVVFRSAPDAVRFAAGAQRTLADNEWPDSREVRVRIGIHTGTGVRAGHEADDYVGIHVHRAARIESAAHGGQVLLSEATRAVAEPDLGGYSFLDLGRHHLKDLDDPEHLFQLEVPGLQTRFPRLRSLAGTPSNLPDDLTSFVGRERVLSDAIDALESARILTLTGPGGTGKTRLSLELGRDRLTEFSDGVFFVDLADIQDPGLVASEVLGAIGLSAPGGISPHEFLIRYVANRHALLIMDNFEQILDAAPLVSSVLREAPGVKIVVTSRAALHVRGERELPVPPLSLPEESESFDPEAIRANEAVSLFVERASSVRPDFRLDHENAADVVRLVSRVDGLPLAIELAAAKVKAFPVSTIVERLTDGMLVGSSRDLPKRQRTITAAIAWSYDMLSGAGRRLFERFSVFMGGAALEQIEAVCGPSEDLGGDLLTALTELVDQSLLTAPGLDGDAEYRMLVTIRDFAADRLAESGSAAEVRRRHLDAYLRLAERAAPELIKSEQAVWLDRIAVDHDNFRAALSWAVAEGEVDAASRLVAALWRFWQIRGHLLEGDERAKEVLALEGGGRRSRLGALEAAGGIGYWRGDPAFLDCYREAVEIARELGEPLELANALYNKSFGVMYEHRDQAIDELHEALAIYDDLGDVEGRARIHWGLGNAFGFSGDYERANEYFTLAEKEFEQSDRMFDRAWALFAIGFGSLQLGDSEDPEEWLRESMKIFRNVGDVSAVVMHLSAFAAAALYRGDRTRAFRLAGAMTRLKEETGYGLVDAPENRYAGLTVRDLQQLEGQDAVALGEGEALTTEDAIAYALGEMDLGEEEA